jgi:hypothetical protein
MRMAAAAIAALSLLGSVGGGMAATWTEVWVPDPGFAIDFPAPPSFATRPVDDTSERRQQYWAAHDGGRVFVVTVVDMPPEAVPEIPTIDYYGHMIEHYAAGSRAMLREDYLETVAGFPGAEAVLDDWTDDVHHLLDLVLVGNRLFMVGSAGPKGHETGADALRFRDSFRLTAPPPAEMPEAEDAPAVP